MFFTVIIPVTRPQNIKRLLKSIGKSVRTSPCKVEVILVCSEKTGINHHERYFECREIVCEELHPSVRRNIGIRKANGDVLVFFDDDIIVPRPWFKEAIKSFHRGIDILTGPTSSPSDSITRKISDYILNSTLGEGIDVYSRKPEAVPEFYDIYLCNCAIRKNILTDIGGFDENIDYTLDDTDFFYRVLKTPCIKPLFSRRAFVYHERRRFPVEFLKHYFCARYRTGKNTVRFPHIFLRLDVIRIILFSYILFPFLLLKNIFKTVFLLYSGLLFINSVYNRKRYGLFSIFMPGILLCYHATVYIAYTVGFFKELKNRFL